MDASISSYISRQMSLSSIQIRSRTIGKDGTPLERRYIYERIKGYVDDFLNDRNTGSRWICIPGFRGTGKTTVISQIHEYLLTNNKLPDSNILHVSMDEVCKLLESDLYELMEGYQSYLGSSVENNNGKMLIIVDEAHYDRKWDITIKTYIDRTKNILFLVTGSSALSLQTSSDSARRVSMNKMYPLTFRESLKLRTGKEQFMHPGTEMEKILFHSKNAREVVEGIDSHRSWINRFWSDIDPYGLEEYLLTGSLPFSMELGTNEDVFERTLQVLNKVIYEDIPRVEKLNVTTLDKIWALIAILSDSREISLDSLANKLDLGKPTVHKIMRILEGSEIIFPVRAYGSTSKQVTKSPKYPFISPLIRASMKWKMGLINDPSGFMGELLEDSVGFYLYKMCYEYPNLHLLHPSGKGEADYILTDDRWNKGIVIEVGYGDEKGTRQVKKTMKRIPSRYSLVISQQDYGVDEDVIFIPLRYFFTC